MFKEFREKVNGLGIGRRNSVKAEEVVVQDYKEREPDLSGARELSARNNFLMIQIRALSRQDLAPLDVYERNNRLVEVVRRSLVSNGDE